MFNYTNIYFPTLIKTSTYFKGHETRVAAGLVLRTLFDVFQRIKKLQEINTDLETEKKRLCDVKREIIHALQTHIAQCSKIMGRSKTVISGERNANVTAQRDEEKN